jgi:hypothetical protein
MFTKITLSNFRRNILGTLSVEIKLPSWRKPQEFCAYPLDPSNFSTIHLQSDKRWIELNPKTGEAKMTNGKGGHPNGWLLMLQEARKQHETFTLSPEDLELLMSEVLKYSSGKVVQLFNQA